jgi:putative endonuclease
MDMYYLYILKSLKDFGYYIGSTDNISKRLEEHNRGKTKSIKHRLPFELVHAKQFNTKKEARQKEIQLKKNYQMRKELLSRLGFGIK